MGGDRIHLEGMIFYGFHGVDPAEKVLGQRFIVDVTVERDLRKPGRTDSVADTVSYATIFKLTRAVVEGPDRKSTRLNSSHSQQSRMPSSA